MTTHNRQGLVASRWSTAAGLLILGPALQLSARPVAAAGAVFDAEFWIEASTTGVERVDDAAACADAFSSLRRVVRSTSATNRLVYELRVGDAGDVGAYEVWVRLATPPSSTRTILVGQDIAGAFAEPQDRFVISRGPVTGYTWLRITRQGTGSASAPEQDPWPVQLSLVASSIEFRLVENDILVDRFAISNESGYLPPDCPVDLADGGPPGGDGDGSYRGARDAECGADEYYDRIDERCRAAVERGCGALPPLWPATLAAAAALARGRRRQRARR